MPLAWPTETVLGEEQVEQWCQAESNYVLDFHGDPIRSRLVVFSDGNHHMALLASLKAFYKENPKVGDIFYATTPPYPILKILQNKAIRLGNLTLSVRPHVFISPPDVLSGLKEHGFIQSHRLLARNRGSVLLVTRKNEKNVQSPADLMRPEVRLFISNPDTEKVSYQGYRQTLEGMARRQNLDVDRFCGSVFDETTVWGHRIHHREAPEALAAGKADAAIVYYHLALRYMRIFPEIFDMIPLGGTKKDPKPYPENLIARIHIGLIADGGEWGHRFEEFMAGRTAAEIYAAHGLDHAHHLKLQ